MAENIPAVSLDLQETKLDCFCPGKLVKELDKSVYVAADTDEKGEEIDASSLDKGEDYSTITAHQPDFDGFCLPVQRF